MDSLTNKATLSFLLAPLVLLAPSCMPSAPAVEDDETSDGTSDDDAGTAGTTDATTDGTGLVDSSSGDTGSSDASTSDASSGDTDSSDTGIEPACGNGIVDAGEDCDDAELAGATCQTLGYTEGTLACDERCAFDVSDCTAELPAAPVLALGVSPVKQLDFSWDPVPGAAHYRLEESAAPGEPFVQLGGDIIGDSVSLTVPLHLRHQASYRLRACNVAGCTDSDAVGVMGSLVEAVGYFKASNTGAYDSFGWSVALSGDGSTLAVGAYFEASNATGIDGDQADDSALGAGAVYVFVRDGMGGWSQQAYVKASNTDAFDNFGQSVSLSEDGSTLAVGALLESSSATGIDGDQASDSASDAGATYVFVRDGMGAWSQQAYVKAPNTGPEDYFGATVQLSADGNTLAVGAHGDDSNATGIDGDQANGAAVSSGAVHVFVRDGLGAWSQQAYIKASNTDAQDLFGVSLALSEDGDTLAVGAYGEDGNATGIDGDQADDSAAFAGAAYVFVRDGMGTWSQQAYVKATNTDPQDFFGISVALSGDGNTLVVGATGEDGSATGIDGDQADDSSSYAGAAYVLVRDGAGAWSHAAYVKATNTDPGDYFGSRVELSADGNTLAVAANQEDSTATGIGGDQADDSGDATGAVYVLVRDGMGAWSHGAYVKASNTDVVNGIEQFGSGVALSADGSTLAVGAFYEDGSATGIDGDQADDSLESSGAVYLY